MPTWFKLLSVLAGWFVSLSVMGSGLHTWSEAATPSFVFGALGQLGVAMGALFTTKPGQPATPDDGD